MPVCLLVSADEKPQDMSLSISTSGNASITVSVEVNGTLYSGLHTTPHFSRRPKQSARHHRHHLNGGVGQMLVCVCV